MCDIKKTACAAVAALSFLAGAAQATPGAAEAQKWERSLVHLKDRATDGLMLRQADAEKLRTLRNEIKRFELEAARLWGQDHECTAAASMLAPVFDEALSLTRSRAADYSAGILARLGYELGMRSAACGVRINP